MAADRWREEWPGVRGKDVVDVFIDLMEQFRVTNKITYEDFAEALGVSCSSYKNIKSRKHSPNVETLRQMASNFQKLDPGFHMPEVDPYVLVDLFVWYQMLLMAQGRPARLGMTGRLDLVDQWAALLSQISACSQEMAQGCRNLASCFRSMKSLTQIIT